MIQERKKSTKHQMMGTGILMGSIVVAAIAFFRLDEKHAQIQVNILFKRNLTVTNETSLVLFV